MPAWDSQGQAPSPCLPPHKSKSLHSRYARAQAHFVCQIQSNLGHISLFSQICKHNEIRCVVSFHLSSACVCVCVRLCPAATVIEVITQSYIYSAAVNQWLIVKEQSRRGSSWIRTLAYTNDHCSVVLMSIKCVMLIGRPISNMHTCTWFCLYVFPLPWPPS